MHSQGQGWRSRRPCQVRTETLLAAAAAICNAAPTCCRGSRAGTQELRPREPQRAACRSRSLHICRREPRQRVLVGEADSRFAVCPTSNLQGYIAREAAHHASDAMQNLARSLSVFPPAAPNASSDPAAAAAPATAAGAVAAALSHPEPSAVPAAPRAVFQPSGQLWAYGRATAARHEPHGAASTDGGLAHTVALERLNPFLEHAALLDQKPGLLFTVGATIICNILVPCVQYSCSVIDLKYASH